MARPQTLASHGEARAAAINAAVLTHLEALAAGDLDHEGVIAMTHEAGEMVVVAYNGGASSWMRLSTIDNPLTKPQIGAALRLQEAFFAGASGSSNAAKIEKWLQTSAKATQRDKDAAAFGHVMSVGDDSGPVRDPHEVMFEAAHLLGYCQKHLGRVSWLVLEMAIRLEYTAGQIASKLGQRPDYASGRIREALAELVGVLRDYDRRGCSETGLAA